MDDLPLPPELAVDEPPFDLALLDAHAADVAVRGGDADPAPEPVQRWLIDSLDAADWAMRLVAGATREAEGVRMQAEAWHQRIDQWTAQQMRPLETRIRFFQTHLEDYALRRREDGGAKSLKLPSGEVGTRGGSPKVVIEDEAAVLAWAKVNAPSAVTTVEKVLVSDLRAAAALLLVIDTARVTLSCGDVLGWASDDRGAKDLLDTFGVTTADEAYMNQGGAVTCPSCEEDVLVGNVEFIASHYEARNADDQTQPIPGAAVELPTTTAKVVPYG